MFETLFQFLFEYRPHVFRQGDFRFAPPAGATLAAVVVVAALAIAFVSYRVLQSRVEWRQRAALGALRVAALGIILFCIFRPVLIVKAAVAHRRAYDKIAAGSYTVTTAGPCTSDLTQLPYRRIRRPIFPLDPAWKPT